MALPSISPANYTGPSLYGVKKEDGRVDYEMMETVAKKEKPKLIICGASAYSRTGIMNGSGRSPMLSAPL